MSDSVGIVKTKEIKLPLGDQGFSLERGGTLAEVSVSYETYGELNNDGNNAILVLHALTGDAHAAGRYSEDDIKPGWWDEFIGPGRAIDTEEYFVICSNVLGGCSGTTGPSSIHPATGKAYGVEFPEITIGDMVEVQYRLCQEIGVSNLFAVIGGSIGGMQALEWSIRFPDFVQRTVCIAAGESLSAQALAFDIIGRKLIMSDPQWQQGGYADSGNLPEQGLAAARMLGHVTYLSYESMAGKFGRERRTDVTTEPFHTDFQVESYLDHQGSALVQRFDPNAYLYITLAADRFSITEAYGSLESAFARSSCEFLIVALSSDWLFPPEQSRDIGNALLAANKKVTYCELGSPYGHDAFLLEVRNLSNVISTFLSKKTFRESDNEDRSAEHLLLKRIFQMIQPKSRVIDLGCGNGTLLKKLRTESGCCIQGVDINLENLLECNRRDLPVFQCDLDHGLCMIPDQTYDYAVLSETIQDIHRPDRIILEMLRIAQTAILTFPNIANWRHRFRLGFRGRLPVRRENQRWYDTPDIHLFSYRDFEDFCDSIGVEIVFADLLSATPMDRLLLKASLRNLGADKVIVQIRKKA